MNEDNKLNIKEGTISFWTRENQINWSGNDVAILFESSLIGSSILILKDSDSRLKFFHVFLGKGRTDVELDVRNLNISEKHFIVATWSMTTGEISLYVDGGKSPETYKTQKISYSTA